MLLAIYLLQLSNSSVLIGIVAALFVLILAWSFNYFIEKSTAKGLKRVIFDHSKM